MLAADLRFPKPKLLKREFIELIWKEESRGEDDGEKGTCRTELRGARTGGEDGQDWGGGGFAGVPC